MDFAQEQRNPTKHLVGIVIVIVFHVLLIYGLVNGLARKVVEVIKQPLETKIIEDIKKLPPDLPPPPPPKLAPPPPAFVPPPEVNVSMAPPAAATITTVTTAVPTAPAPIVATARTNPSVGRCPDSDSVYPAAARRLEQEGTVMLRVLVGADGQVMESEVEKSSGFPSLDEAARSAVKQCRGGKPGTVDGHTEPAWVKLKYTFRIQ